MCPHANGLVIGALPLDACEVHTHTHTLCILAYMCDACMHACIQISMHIQTDRQTDRQTDKQTDR